MKLLFIGPQGSGKGTQAKIISRKLGIPHISTGDLLRSQTGKLREEIDSYIVGGNLLPSELTLKILKTRLDEDDCSRGYILDGFPRNTTQADMLDNIAKIDEVIEIYISDEESVRRLKGRVNCEGCGAGYNLVTMPPKNDGNCDECDGELVQRDDDKEEAIKKRLEIYHRDTEPLLDRYESVRVNGAQGIENVTRDILKVVN